MIAVNATLDVLTELGDEEAIMALLTVQGLVELFPWRKCLVVWHQPTDAFETFLEAAK